MVIVPFIQTLNDMLMTPTANSVRCTLRLFLQSAWIVVLGSLMLQPGMVEGKDLFDGRRQDALFHELQCSASVVRPRTRAV